MTANVGTVDLMSADAQRVKQLLAGLRYPAMPEHLAARIDGAIAVEAAIRLDEPTTGRVVRSPVTWSTLARQAASARAQSKLLRDDASKVARLVGETEDAMAVTMDKLAAQNPAHAELLSELSRAARQWATQATDWHERSTNRQSGAPPVPA